MITYEEATTPIPISQKKLKVRDFNKIELTFFILPPEQPIQTTRVLWQEQWQTLRYNEIFALISFDIFMML